MPLHAITAVYGEQGLRARLAIETGRLDDAASRQKISEALELAGRLHAADRRQREPYINHLLRVALRIICHYGIRDTDIICAALLHDAVEDHAGDLAATGGRPGALGVLAARFGPQAAALVEAVTNPVYLPGQDADEQYRAHVAASLAASPGARVIKVSDFTDYADVWIMPTFVRSSCSAGVGELEVVGIIRGLPGRRGVSGAR